MGARIASAGARINSHAYDKVLRRCSHTPAQKAAHSAWLSSNVELDDALQSVMAEESAGGAALYESADGSMEADSRVAAMRSRKAGRSKNDGFSRQIFKAKRASRDDYC